MAELTPQERLQPCLLDRLTDEQPQVQVESRTQRVVSQQRYRRGVERDLVWLFNTDAHLFLSHGEREKVTRYPYAEKSVINFGVRQLTGLTVTDLRELEQQIEESIRRFEPRIDARSVELVVGKERNILSFRLRGELWANPLPEQLDVNTQVDLETGRCMLGDGWHG
jgi:type VI secretion system protein ImpF